MRVIIFSILFSFLLVSCQQSDKTADTSEKGGDSSISAKDTIEVVPPVPVKIPEDENFEGTINKKIGIKIHIYKHDSLIYGEVVYKKTGVPITVLGKVLWDGSYFFNEFDKTNNITGMYSFNKVNDSIYAGDWNTPGNYTVAYKLQLKKQPDADIPSPLVDKVDGQYGYNAGDPGNGSLFIQQLPNDSLYFFFECLGPNTGADIAVLKAKGILEKNKMTCTFTGKDNKTTCGAIIRFIPGGAYVEQIGESDPCGIASYTSVSGMYYKMNGKIPDVEKMESDAQQ